jgi:hypothetical protein
VNPHGSLSEQNALARRQMAPLMAALLPRLKAPQPQPAWLGIVTPEWLVEEVTAAAPVVRPLVSVVNATLAMPSRAAMWAMKGLPVTNEEERRAGIEGGTLRTIEGPLDIAGAPIEPGSARLDDGTETGEVLIMKGQARDEDGRPVANAVVDVWHADIQGGYSFFDPSQST